MAETKEDKEKKEPTLWDKAIRTTIDATKDVADARVPRDLTNQIDKLASKTGGKIRRGTYSAFNTSLGALGLKDEFKEFKESKLGIALGHEVNRYVKDFLEQMHTILTNWYNDPITLCCLIRLLGAIERQEIKNNNPLTFLKTLKATLDVMISWLSEKTRLTLVNLFDILTFATEMAIAAVIMVVNGALDSFASRIYQQITVSLGLTNKAGEQRGIAKCLPFDELMETVLQFFIGDYGLLQFVKKYVKDFMSKLREDFKKTAEEENDALKNLKKIEFLRRMRNVVNILIRAVENGEICLEMDFDEVKQRDLANPEGVPPRWYDPVAAEWIENIVPGTLGSKAQRELLKKRSVSSVMKEVAMTIPSESEMRSFYKKSMGYSDQQTDQAMTTNLYSLDCGEEVTKEVYDIYSRIVNEISNVEEGT